MVDLYNSKSRSTLVYDMVLLHPRYIATAFYVVHYKTIVICHTDTRTHSHTQGRNSISIPGNMPEAQGWMSSHKYKHTHSYSVTAVSAALQLM